jgi:hypothetical protein
VRLLDDGVEHPQPDAYIDLRPGEARELDCSPAQDAERPRRARALVTVAFEISSTPAPTTH